VKTKEIENPEEVEVSEYKFADLKKWLKYEAKQLRERKGQTKTAQRERTAGSSELQYSLHNARRNYRHHHIAYSELRGLERDQIEKPRVENLPSEAEITRLKKKYGSRQALRSIA
jgi:hypothetical protein